MVWEMLAFALLVSSSYLFKAVAMFLVLVNSWKNIPVTLPYPCCTTPAITAPIQRSAPGVVL